MFGYVRPPLALLAPEEADRFRRIYCGLCRTLGQRHGQRARLILNYDFTFLAILLSAGEEETGGGCCVAHPIRRRAYTRPTAALELAADESVILAWWQLRDGAEDRDHFGGLGDRAAAAALEGAYRAAAALRPAFDEAVHLQLQTLHALEAERSPSMDRAADAFAVLLSAAAGEAEEPVRRRVLEQLLYHLGRWVYLIDAADDLKKDAASGSYNHVALRYGLEDGRWTEESRRAFSATLDHSVHMMTTAFELWDFGAWTPILEATLYTGLFQVGRAVLDGTFHQRGKEKKNIQEG